MGILRGSALFLSCSLLFAVVLIQGFFLVLYLSLSYDSVYSQVYSTALDSVDVLENNSFLNYEENLSAEEMASLMIKSKYYEDYDCGFFDCVQKTNEPLSLISKNAQDYWKSKLLSVFLIFIFLESAIFLLVQKKSNFFLISSIFLGIASFLIFNLNTAVEFIYRFIPSFEFLTAYSFFSLLSVFFSEYLFAFKTYFFAFLLFFGVFIFLKLFEIREKFSNFAVRVSKFFKKEPANQEIQKKSFRGKLKKK